MNKHIKVILFTSIIINLLLVGFIIGQNSHRFHHHWKKHKVVDLTPEQQTNVKGVLKNIKASNKSKRKEIRKTHKAMMTLLKAEQFDAKAFRNKAEELKQLKEEMIENMSGQLAHDAETLTQPEREALATMIKMKKKRWCRNKR